MSTTENRHIDIQISADNAEAANALANELEALIEKRTSSWVTRRKMERGEYVQTRTYHTVGEFTHWLDKTRKRVNGEGAQ